MQRNSVIINFDKKKVLSIMNSCIKSSIKSRHVSMLNKPKLRRQQRIFTISKAYKACIYTSCTIYEHLSAKALQSNSNKSVRAKRKEREKKKSKDPVEAAGCAVYRLIYSCPWRTISSRHGRPLVTLFAFRPNATPSSIGQTSQLHAD